MRPFGTFTPDLYALADWLAACRIETVAMESTGVYWISAYEILEARGFQVHLVNARHLKHVPARKSDDMRTWPNGKVCCSWLGLAPRHEISGGKVMRRSTLKTRNRAGQALRLAAQAAGRSHSGLGDFYRRMRTRLVPASAIVATAHKIARTVYHLLTHRPPFCDLSVEEYTQRARAREIVAMRKRAPRLGLTLVALPAW